MSSSQKKYGLWFPWLRSTVSCLMKGFGNGLARLSSGRGEGVSGAAAGPREAGRAQNGEAQVRKCYGYPMRSTASKQRILDALDTLSDDASVEQAIERLYFLAKIEKGLAQLDAGQSVDHEEVKRRVGL
jgi:hypothetical protein